MKRAGRVIVIVVGDGAPWIWNIADERLYDTIQIIDLYHARQHLTDPATIKANDWAAGRSQQLDEGNIEAVLSALRRRRPRDEAALKAVRSTLHYFQSNAKRMRYADFRSQSRFVGSGVVEAGCKIVIGHRLKQSGMQWTVRGANEIIALRCLQLSGRPACLAAGRWEEFWKARERG